MKICNCRECLSVYGDNPPCLKGGCPVKEEEDHEYDNHCEQDS